MRGHVVERCRVLARARLVVPRNARQRVILVRRSRANLRREPRVWNLLTAGIDPRESNPALVLRAPDVGELGRVGLPKAPHGLEVHGGGRPHLSRAPLARNAIGRDDYGIGPVRIRVRLWLRVASVVVSSRDETSPFACGLLNKCNRKPEITSRVISLRTRKESFRCRRGFF